MKKGNIIILMFMAMILLISIPVVSAMSFQTFRQKNGLQAYTPPDWFLKGYFIACEKNPGYIFGSVQDFVRTLGGTTTWLIEDLELERLKEASANGQKIEFSLYLESVSPDRTEYWVFVVLPFENAQAWYDAKRAYHGRKAEKYYGTTRKELERAQNQGLSINAELRFWIENDDTSLRSPENVIMRKYKFRPVFNLSKGCRLGPAAKSE